MSLGVEENFLDSFPNLIAVAARSKACVSAAHWLGLRVRIPPRAWMSVSCECYVFSGRGLCVGMIIRTEEAYRLRL